MSPQERVDRRQAINKHLVLSSENIQAGRYYTLITHAFAHTDVGHLAFNMFAFYSFGQVVSMVFGTTALLTIFFGGALVGGITSLTLQKERRTGWGQKISQGYLGASGGCLAVSTALACAFPTSKMLLMFIVSRSFTGTTAKIP